MEQIILISGKPVPKGRPRFKLIRGEVKIFTPAATTKYENYVRNCYRKKYSTPMPATPLRVEMVVYYPLNKSDYNGETLSASGRRKLGGEEKPTKKPDLDNIAKAILDGLNGAAYKDDSQIVELSIYKEYARVPGVLVILTDELEGAKNGNTKRNT